MLRSISRLSAADLILVAKACLLLKAFRVLLWVCPTRTLRKFLDRSPQPGQACDDLADHIAWAVNLASRHYVASSCLTRALATITLLERHRCRAELQIGVSTDANGGFEAHAWVLSGGRVIVGQLEDFSRFTPLRRNAMGGQRLPQAT